MRRASVGFAAAATMAAMLVGAPSASAQEQLAASCEPPPANTSAGGGPHQRFYAQTFTPLLSGLLTRAEIAVTEIEDTSDLGDYLVQIRTTDASGEPSDVVLASATIPDDDVTPNAFPSADIPMVSVTFADPAAVVAGQLYAIVFTRPGTGRLAAGSRNSTECPGDGFESIDGGASWGGQPDFVFRVFVTPPATPGVFTCKGEQATHVGTDGNDEIGGTNGTDVIVALGGNDTVRGGDGDDLVCGNRGRDVIRGQDGDDKLFGSRGRDRLFGGPAADLLVGGAKGDSLIGGGGKDKLRGGSPNAPGKDARDLCQGGAANDKLKNCER